MSKKITIIGINYYPEDSAIGLYTTQKAEYLFAEGFEVTVVTGFPYYPQWEIREDYKSKQHFLKEEINGVKVYRSKQYVPHNPTFLKRVLHIVSFTFVNFITLFRIDKPDIVISIIPFTTSSLLAWFLKIRYKCKHWIHIQDFEFDAAIDSGLLKGNKSFVIRVLQNIEKFVLNRADVVSTISIGMMNKLKIKANTNYYYLTNWVDVDTFNNKELKQHKYLKSDKFNILYSGNIGAKQDWEFFIRILNKLKSVNGVEVTVVGEGAEKKALIKQLKNYTFVRHFNLVPYDELPSLLSSADLHVLFQKIDVIDTVMPSKILGMMASGKPSLITGNLKSEVAKVFKESNGGFYFDGKSIEDVIQQINILKNDNELRLNLGKNAQHYVGYKYGKDKVLKKFKEELLKL